MIRFGRLAKGGTRVAYLKYEDRKVMKKIMKKLKASEELPSPHSYSTSSVLDAYHKQISQQYQEKRSDIRKEAENAFNQYEEEQNVFFFL